MAADWESSKGQLACDRCAFVRSAVRRKGMNLCTDCKDTLTPEEREMWRQQPSLVGAVP